MCVGLRPSGVFLAAWILWPFLRGIETLFLGLGFFLAYFVYLIGMWILDCDVIFFYHEERRFGEG